MPANFSKGNLNTKHCNLSQSFSDQNLSLVAFASVCVSGVAEVCDQFWDIIKLHQVLLVTYFFQIVYSGLSVWCIIIYHSVKCPGSFGFCIVSILCTQKLIFNVSFRKTYTILILIQKSHVTGTFRPEGTCIVNIITPHKKAWF